MLTALNVVVGLIVGAIGANFIWTSEEVAADEGDVLGTGRRWVPVRSWSHRLSGVLLIGLGLAILVNPLF